MPDYAKKMKKDLEDAAKLLKTWNKDPAEVFIEYELADNKADVKKIERRTCGCGCIAKLVEFELEKELV